MSMEIQKPKTTSQNTKTTRTHKKHHMGPLSSSGSKRRRFSTDQRREEDEEEGVLEEKMVALQRIVPGGEGLGGGELFEETAGYIMELETQVLALRALNTFFEELHKEKMKLGG